MAQYGSMTLREREDKNKLRKREDKNQDSSDASLPRETKRNRKLNPFSRKAVKMSRSKYDEEGNDKETGENLCDCLIDNCPGCWMPCPTCGSKKCGPECRIFRRYRYDSVEVEGTSVMIKSKFSK